MHRQSLNRQSLSMSAPQLEVGQFFTSKCACQCVFWNPIHVHGAWSGDVWIVNQSIHEKCYVFNGSCGHSAREHCNLALPERTSDKQLRMAESMLFVCSS